MEMMLCVKEITFTLKNEMMELGPFRLNKCADGIAIFVNNLTISEEMQEKMKEEFSNIFEERKVKFIDKKDEN